MDSSLFVFARISRCIMESGNWLLIYIGGNYNGKREEYGTGIQGDL